MKIVSFTVKNFGCLSGEGNSIRFDNSDTIFIIGKNNLGKSTFLKAYEFFIESKRKATIDDFYQKNMSIPIEIECTYLKEDSDDSDTELSKEPGWVDKWVDEQQYIRIKKIWSSQGNFGEKFTYNPKTEEYEKGGFGGFDTLLTKYSPTPIFINAVTTKEELEKQVNSIVSTEHIKKLKTKYADDYEKISDSLQRINAEIVSSDEVGNINDNMNRFFSNVFPDLKLEIDSSKSDFDLTKTLTSSHIVKVKKATSGYGDENNFSISRNGDGVIRQALFSFISSYGIEYDGNRKQYLILFEEPELYLHPKATFSLREQLYALATDSPFQILCATHSPLMIDVSKPHSSLVRISTNCDDKSKIHQVDFDIFEDEDKEKLQMINRFNPHVCECFFADQVILVEGDTEAVFYRTLINSIYSEEISSLNKNIFILNTGSKANLVFYQKMITHFGIDHVVVHDADSPTNSDGSINAMWTMNKKIWDQIVESNKDGEIARRYVHTKNFEDAHEYKYDSTAGKPLSAYRFALKIRREDTLPCNEFLTDLFNEGNINHSQESIESTLVSK